MPPELSSVEMETSVPVLARQWLAPASGGSNDAGWDELKDLCFRMLTPESAARPTAAGLAGSSILRPSVELLMEQCPRLRTIIHSERAAATSSKSDATIQGASKSSKGTTDRTTTASRR